MFSVLSLFFFLSLNKIPSDGFELQGNKNKYLFLQCENMEEAGWFWRGLHLTQWSHFSSGEYRWDKLSMGLSL